MHPVSSVLSTAASFTGITAKMALANPLITTIAIAILTSDKWIPKAECGPLAFMACYASCMAASNAATSGAFLPATQLFCQQLCAPLLAAPTP